MKTTLSSVLYVSSATTAFSDQELVRFLRSWRDRNAERQITGFLLYEQGNFIQAIEGPGVAMDELVTAIEADSRHNGMIVLWKKAIPEREFADWCMGFRGTSELRPEDRQTFSSLLQDARQEEKFRNHAGAAHRTLAQFKSVCLPQYNA